MTDYVVMLSGGVASLEALRRIKERDSRADVVALFADTKNEHPDLYRFLDDIDRLYHPVTEIADGRNIWDVFKDQHMIGNARVPICSIELKINPCQEWIIEHKPGATVVMGMDWTEEHRIEKNRKAWNKKGFSVEYPLTERPYLWRNDYYARCRELGIEIPELYKLGFEHNNCGGACVRSGQGGWALLLNADRDRYLSEEEKEEYMREYLGKDVSILVDQSTKPRTPLTLKDFRERIEDGEKPQDSLFSCSCMDIG